MADDKRSREKQARDEDNRQRRRDLVEELERGDETEPPVDASALGELESSLGKVEFPATGAELVSVVGDHEIETPDGTYSVAELLPETDTVTIESPAAVRMRVQRPTIAAAMKRVTEATESVPNVELGRSQREAYEKTFRALQGIDVDDDDAGIQFIGEWIVEQLEAKGKLSGSRGVRREAAELCRSEGYTVRNDQWLGV